ncbi:hypothetical protein M2410_001001 [Stenotrophomonas chelatiphaga]|nr:hypothetical protein [Stenotrophomonas chelatiphaga]
MRGDAGRRWRRSGKAVFQSVKTLVWFRVFR